MAELRLQKVLAAAGIASRRGCEEIIREGLVRVNRKIVDKLPVFVDPDKDIITFQSPSEIDLSADGVEWCRKNTSQLS